MEATLHLVFIVGVIINLIKGGDLILRPHQQKRIQDKFESLALWLDYKRPLQTYQKVPKDVHRQFFIFGPFVLGCFVVLMLYAWGKYPLWGVISTVIITARFVIQIMHSSIDPEDSDEEVFMDRTEVHNFFEYVPYWILRNKSLPVQLTKHAFLASISVGLWWFYVSVGKDPNPSGLRIALTFAALIVSMPYTTLVGGPSLVVTLVAFSVVTIEGILIFLRAIVWRVVEYNKGAFAALVLIVTIGLGIVELYLKLSDG